jgi:transcriptional pleiotropic regulator of transition state genes
MKSTGVIRKIDDLGRIVIPMEIRKNMRVKEGEMFEIFIDGETICLKRHYDSDSYLAIAKLLSAELEGNNEEIPNAGEVKKRLDEIVKLLKG